MTTLVDQSKTMTGRKVLWIALSFFGVVVGVNLLFVFLSLSSFEGVTVEKAYYKGRDYNQTLEQARAQDALGWTIKAASSDGGIVFDIEKDAKQIAGLKGIVTIKRPIESKYDQLVEIQSLPDGRYFVPAEMPLKGKWVIVLETSAADGTLVRREFETFRK